MANWTVKSRWFVLLNWSFQEGFLDKSVDIRNRVDGDGEVQGSECQAQTSVVGRDQEGIRAQQNISVTSAIDWLRLADWL